MPAEAERPAGQFSRRPTPIAIAVEFENADLISGSSARARTP
jgi:hypothetical protein